MRCRAYIIFTITKCIIFFMIPLSAMASDRNNYVVYKQGIYSVESDNLQDSDTKFYGELSLGHDFIRYFAIEGGITYFTTEATAEDLDPSLGSPTGKFEYKVISFTLTAKGFYPFRFFPIKEGKLYVGIGPGYYYIDSSADLSTTAVGKISINDTNTTFGIQTEVGVEVKITKTLFFGIAGKYIKTNEAKFKGEAENIPIQVNADLSRFVITGNIGLRF